MSELLNKQYFASSDQSGGGSGRSQFDQLRQLYANAATRVTGVQQEGASSFLTIQRYGRDVFLQLPSPQEGFKPYVTPEGFAVGGINDTVFLGNIETIKGIPVVSLEEALRKERYLAEGESLPQSLAKDNQTVLENLGTTHQELGSFLSYFPYADIQTDRVRTTDIVATPGSYLYKGRVYHCATSRERHGVASPFGDGQKTAATYTLTSLEDGSAVTFSSLAPEMIAMYGFYGSINPRAIARVAGIRLIPISDEVVQLQQNPELGTILDDADEITRALNLVNIGFQYPQASFVPRSGDSLIAVVQRVASLAPRYRSLLASSQINLGAIPDHSIDVNTKYYSGRIGGAIVAGFKDRVAEVRNKFTAESRSQDFYENH